MYSYRKLKYLRQVYLMKILLKEVVIKEVLGGWLLEGLDGLNLLAKARVFGSCVIKMLVWHLRPERKN